MTNREAHEFAFSQLKAGVISDADYEELLDLLEVELPSSTKAELSQEN